MSHPDIRYTLFIMAALCALIAAFKFAASDGEDWQAFRIAHHCQAIAHHPSPEGQGIGISSTTWACDDGKVYVKRDE